ncbi:MAG TPA: hypothetical protein VNI77_09660 [Nitrososphaera sp.]|nr:hypothetical protein [Nitrososphaera sp.]
MNTEDWKLEVNPSFLLTILSLARKAPGGRGLELLVNLHNYAIFIRKAFAPRKKQDRFVWKIVANPPGRNMAVWR